MVKRVLLIYPTVPFFLNYLEIYSSKVFLTINCFIFFNYDAN